MNVQPRTKDISDIFDSPSPVNVEVSRDRQSKTKESGKISNCSLLSNFDSEIKDGDELDLSSRLKSSGSNHVSGKPPNRGHYAADPQCNDHGYPPTTLAPFKVPRVPSLDTSDLLGSIPRTGSNLRKRVREIGNSMDEEIAHITSKIRRKIHTVLRPLSPLPASPVFIENNKVTPVTPVTLVTPVNTGKLLSILMIMLMSIVKFN